MNKLITPDEFFSRIEKICEDTANKYYPEEEREEAKQRLIFYTYASMGGSLNNGPMKMEENT